MVARRGGAVALLLSLLVSAALGAGCANRRTTALPGGGGYDRDAAVFQECSSICRRPGDCAEAFPDDGICPPGFLCALRFSCSSD
ncbi:MAG: hypothetical protein JWN44_3368 [Myxococcales bacterium]|nr:hypothetical protein [Myxococcales bacterium]